jgi:hypothetical protein
MTAPGGNQPLPKPPWQLLASIPKERRPDVARPTWEDEQTLAGDPPILTLKFGGSPASIQVGCCQEL